MNKAIHHILTHCGGLKAGEDVLVVHDFSPIGDIVDAFIAATEELNASGLAIRIPAGGREPYNLVANLMRDSDLTISLCQQSLAHTRARQGAKRFLSLPDYSWEILNHPAVMVDYEAQAPIVRRFADAFTNGNEIRVKADGTDVTMSIGGRVGNYCPGFVRRPGDLGSPPDIEANIAPIEGSAKGEWFGNLATLAECGVGLNPLAKVTNRLLLIDEGAFGSVHFGLGSNHTIGGTRDVGYHKDYVMPNASLWVDGVQMLKDGELC